MGKSGWFKNSRRLRIVDQNSVPGGQARSRHLTRTNSALPSQVLDVLKCIRVGRWSQQAVVSGTNVPFPLRETFRCFPHVSNWVTPAEEPSSALDSHPMSLSRGRGSVSKLYDRIFGDIPEGGCKVADEREMPAAARPLRFCFAAGEGSLVWLVGGASEPVLPLPQAEPLRCCSVTGPVS